MQKLILSSASPHRLQLLHQAQIKPDLIQPVDLDETMLPNEKLADYVRRLALAKAYMCASQLSVTASSCNFILGADTIVVKNNCLLDKALTEEDVLRYLKLYQKGGRVKIITAICLIKQQYDSLTMRHKIVTSSVKCARLTEKQITEYLASGEGLNVAGGMRIAGMASRFFYDLKGSYSGIVGLPIYETCNLLTGLGYNLS